MSLSNSTLISAEFWFIPLDILNFLCTAFGFIIALVFSIVIILDKTCRTVSMISVVNTWFSELLFGFNVLGSTSLTLYNDVNHINTPSSFCTYQGFFSYTVVALQNYSYLFQALYRYVIVVYPQHRFRLTGKTQILILSLIWFLAFIFPLSHILSNQIKYHADSQICQMPLELSFLTIYNVLCVYIIPISLTQIIYSKLVTYVKEMSTRVTPANILSHTLRELTMVRRIVVLLTIISALGFPYTVFILMSFFTAPPKYHFRIAFTFVYVSFALVMMALFQFTEPLKTALINRLPKRTNRVLPTMT